MPRESRSTVHAAQHHETRHRPGHAKDHTGTTTRLQQTQCTISAQSDACRRNTGCSSSRLPEMPNHLPRAKTLPQTARKRNLHDAALLCNFHTVAQMQSSHTPTPQKHQISWCISPIMARPALLHRAVGEGVDSFLSTSSSGGRRDCSRSRTCPKPHRSPWKYPID